MHHLSTSTRDEGQVITFCLDLSGVPLPKKESFVVKKTTFEISIERPAISLILQEVSNFMRILFESLRPNPSSLHFNLYSTARNYARTNIHRQNFPSLIDSFAKLESSPSFNPPHFHVLLSKVKRDTSHLFLILRNSPSLDKVKKKPHFLSFFLSFVLVAPISNA